MPKKPQRRPMSRPLMVALAVVGAAALGVVFWLLGRTTEENWGIESAFALSDGSVLLVERAGLDNDIYDRGRLRIVARDGHEVRRSEEVEMVMQPRGIVDGGVWIESHEGGLELWTFADLAPRPGAKAAFAGTPLAQKRQPHGTHEGRLDLAGADDRHYLVDSGYGIERQAKDFSPTLQVGVPIALERSMALDTTDLVRPRPILAPAGGPLVLDGGKSMLVLSSDADGSSNTTMLSRVDVGGAVRWSVSARDLSTPHEPDAPAYYAFALIDIADGVVFAVVQSTLVQSSRAEDSTGTWGEYDVRLVDLDPDDGRVLASRAIAVP